MARCNFKRWGKYPEQTVRQSRASKKQIIVRKGDQEVTVRKDEIDSLVITLLQMRKCK